MEKEEEEVTAEEEVEEDSVEEEVEMEPEEDQEEDQEEDPEEDGGSAREGRALAAPATRLPDLPPQQPATSYNPGGGGGVGKLGITLSGGDAGSQ